MMIAQGPTGQQQGRQKERIGFDNPLYIGHRRVQVGLKLGQGHVDDRPVNEDHTGADDGRRQDPRPQIFGHRLGIRDGLDNRRMGFLPANIS